MTQEVKGATSPTQTQTDAGAGDREAYTNRLFLRIITIIRQEMPTGFEREHETWERLAETDRMLMNAAKAYEQGVASKEELDRAGILHLSKLREAFEQHRASRTQAA